MTLGRWKSPLQERHSCSLPSAVVWPRRAATITGTHHREGGGQPLADARVIVLGTVAVRHRGEDGKYTLRNVPPGSVTIQVLRVGYHSLKQSVDVTAGGTADQPTSRSTVAVVQLEEVVTTATGQAAQESSSATRSRRSATSRSASKNAEISTTADLLIAKAPGVIVLAGHRRSAARRPSASAASRRSA